MESLDVTWVSRANAMQRRGRAGRVTKGVAFHLFTSHTFYNHFRDQPIPGMTFLLPLGFYHVFIQVVH